MPLNLLEPIKDLSYMNKFQKLSFSNLVQIITDAHIQLSDKAKKAVNTCLTIRNWLIGYYIAEYELKGSDRANYGDKLLKELSANLGTLGVSNSNKRQLYDYIKFYRTYPQIAPTVSAQFEEVLPHFKFVNEKVPTLSAQSLLAPKELLSNISYSMFKLLVEINEEAKRNFMNQSVLRETGRFES